MQLSHFAVPYLEFAFSVTKGISVDSIVAQLPAHLQLEVHLELNKKLVEQVHIFAGCDRDFFDALVIKLQPCICTSGVYVFYDGEADNKMYFVKHGMAEVVCSVIDRGMNPDPNAPSTQMFYYILSCQRISTEFPCEVSDAVLESIGRVSEDMSIVHSRIQCCLIHIA